MRLYRGIAVPATTADEIIKSILTGGLSQGQGRWVLPFNDLRKHRRRLLAQCTLTLADTRPNAPPDHWICACSDFESAAYYACRHNRDDTDNTPILITFEAHLRDLIVDGRDFLYTLFQLGKPERARPVARKLFGMNIDRYLDRAWATEDTNERIALCDLAVQDESVIRAHALNHLVIGGRHNTLFKNAFMARLPVAPGKITDARKLDEQVNFLRSADITLDDIRPD